MGKAGGTRDVVRGVAAGRPVAADGMESHTLTVASEDYLEAILRITQEQDATEGIRSVDVAERLGVSKASVSKALTTLKDAGFVEQAHYGKVSLTPSGLAYASDIWRCHRMLRAFLERDLGVDPKVADDEACRMEHGLSHDTMLRWIGFLGKQGIEVEE